jgi:hypothetical protein
MYRAYGHHHPVVDLQTGQHLYQLPHHAVLKCSQTQWKCISVTWPIYKQSLIASLTQSQGHLDSCIAIHKCHCCWILFENRQLVCIVPGRQKTQDIGRLECSPTFTMYWLHCRKNSTITVQKYLLNVSLSKTKTNMKRMSTNIITLCMLCTKYQTIAFVVNGSDW